MGLGSEPGAGVDNLGLGLDLGLGSGVGDNLGSVLGLGLGSLDGIDDLGFGAVVALVGLGLGLGWGGAREV